VVVEFLAETGSAAEKESSDGASQAA
jgi:hypothetical protein